MKKYTITGMSCAACSARVEKAVSAVNGVTSCSVNLLTNSMTVSGNVGDNEIISAVIRAGYGASPHGAKGDGNGANIHSANDKSGIQKSPNTEIKNTLSRLAASAIFLILLMYVSMGYVMWGAPLPAFLSGNPISTALAELLLSAAILVINQKFFISGARGILRLSPNMDTLVAIGSGTSFIYSTCLLFLMLNAQAAGNSAAAEHYLHGLYFESAAMILTLITVGKLLEALSKGRTTRSLRALTDLSPKTATVLVDGEEKRIDASKINKGDIFIVRPGESIPTDGAVLDGSSSVDESALTGESAPCDKTQGSKVFAGTINLSGYIKCEAVRVGEDTALSEIIKIVSDATASKAPIARAADKVSGIFVPIVMAISLVSTAAWLIAGKELGFALARGISVLVISCPCALGLATPVAIMVGGGLGARRGILFKSAAALENCGRATVAMLDKTGTVTEGKMTVTDITAADGTDEKTLLSLAASLEKMSEHPLGTAIVGYAEENGAELLKISDFSALSGNGVEGKYNGQSLRGGKQAFIKDKCHIPNTASEKAQILSCEGKTPMFFSLGERFLGIIAVADTVKKDSAKAVAELKRMGLHTVMLTGDNERTARAIGEEVGVDEVIADVLPDGKAEIIKQLKEKGSKVIMVGDGINDAPALALADTGIAIGAGTDVAIETADVVLVKSRLDDLCAAVRLSRKTLKNIHENLFWAFCYNVIGIPLAAGLWIPVFGLDIDPMFGAAAMSLSSFCVVMNALRLNLFDVYKPSRFKRAVKIKKKKKVKTMKKTIAVEGMMCPHCSGRVKKALEELDAVESAEVSHESGKAVVTLRTSVSDEVLKKTVEEQGYSVTGME